MKDNTKIALTVKQKQLIADFKDLLKKMENENIGIVGELNYFSKWEKNYLYLQLFNKEEVESVEKYCDIDEVEEENEEFVVNENDVEKIELPSKLTKIPNFMFYGALALKDVTIPDGVTEIGSWAFASCTSLERIDIKLFV